jgi:DNA-binding GntR family transcriptional regulator
VLEPYAARLAAARGSDRQWAEMADELKATKKAKGDNEQLMAIDRRCHELMWEAADNRFLLDTLDTLYAQSDRLWHLYLSEVADMGHVVTEHAEILAALEARDGDVVADLVEAHVRAFDEDIRAAVTERLESPLAG